MTTKKMDLQELDRIAAGDETWDIPYLYLVELSKAQHEPSSIIDFVREYTVSRPTNPDILKKLQRTTPKAHEKLCFPPQYNNDDKETRINITSLLNRIPAGSSTKCSSRV